MKRLQFLGVAMCFLFASLSANAQFEVKINPIGALFQSPDVSVEYIVNDNFGVEGKLGYAWANREVLGVTGSESKSQGVNLALLGKYYFNPDEGADRFYAGLYGKFGYASSKSDASSTFAIADYTQTRLALGALVGFKWVGGNGIVLDINFGVGRALLNNYNSDDPDIDNLLESIDIDAIGTIALGYRFPGK